MKVKKAAAVLLAAMVVVLLALSVIQDYANDRSVKRRMDLEARTGELESLREEVTALDDRLIRQAEGEVQRLQQEAEDLLRQASDADARREELLSKIEQLQKDYAGELEKNEYLGKVYDALYEGLETARGYLAGD